MIVYEMCVLFFKMAADLRTQDANCEALLCHSILGYLVCRNVHLYHDNPHVWEEITNFINAHLGKAFSVRRVMRQWKRTRRNYQSSMGLFGAMIPPCPLQTDCPMTHLSKRWMHSRTNVVHVLFDILLTYFVPIMFSSVLCYGLACIQPCTNVVVFVMGSIFCISHHTIYVVNLDEVFIYYCCFLYIATISYILCMLFLIHVDLTV